MALIVASIDSQLVARSFEVTIAAVLIHQCD